MRIGTSGSSPDQKVALITGAASGIGQATANLFAANGYASVGIDLVDTDAPGHREWPLYICDVSDEAAVQTTIAEVFDRFGRIDVLANVAGIVLVKPLVDTSWDEFRRLVDVNLGGTFLMCKHVSRVMRDRESGVIVNAGSVSGHVGQVDHSLYGATKGGIAALGRALAWELAPDGIRVVTISPGSVDTPMLRSDIELEASKTGKTYDEVKALRAEEQAFRRWADPDEVAQVIVFVAGDGASFVTGADLLVDGGWVAR